MSGSFRAVEGARSMYSRGEGTGMSPDEHMEYAPFGAEAFYTSFLHKRRQGSRIYPGMVTEAD
jgi:hypothetical protein